MRNENVTILVNLEEKKNIYYIGQRKESKPKKYFGIDDNDNAFISSLCSVGD